MGTTKGEHALSEAEDVLVSFQTAPVVPARFVVLAVGVVVPVLGAPKFVSTKQHGHPARYQKSQQEVLDLPSPHSLDAGVRGLALNAVVSLRLWSVPSWLPSPFASLCLSR